MRSPRQALAQRTAARLHAWEGDPVVEELPAPEPGEGEALVELAAGAVAHIDLTVATGRFAFRPALPYVPGTEGAGRVLRSATLAEGTPVRVRGARVGLERDGTWASHAAVPHEALEPLPADVDLVVAAGFFSPCVTAHAALHEVGGLVAGESVAVVGAGGAVGAMVVQLARRAGAARVVGVERDARRAAAIPAGAERVVGDDLGERVDLLVDTVGGARLPALVTGAVVPGGRAVLVGYAGGTEATFALPALLAADVRLLPMNLIRWERRLRPVAADLLRDLAAGTLELPRTVLPLHRVAEAVALVREGRATGRVVIEP